jgi:hypothetical protein
MAFDATTFEIGKNRIEALSDGIFAIVMTLLQALTAVICFWSVGISLAIYLLLLPLYMLPGKSWGAKSRGLEIAS